MMNTIRKKFLREKADFIRGEIERVCVKNNAGHIAPSLSAVDILTALYYQVMNHKPGEPEWPERDRLIFSKAHGCYALYAILYDLGYIPGSEWDDFYLRENSLKGCLERNLKHGIESGCGSLGHGLPIAAGLALGAAMLGAEYRIYCVMGDGELQEGTTWEALQFSAKHELSNLVIIIDANRLQAMDFTENIMDRTDKDISARLKGFGLNPVECGGHDVVKLAGRLEKLSEPAGKSPKVLIARTVKGYGLLCMENVPKFHFRIPTKEELSAGRRYAVE